MMVAFARRLPARVRSAWPRFPGCARGVAAIEFAMVLPLMVLMYLGATELTFGINTDRKLTFLSRTVADLTGRVPKLTATLMGDIFDASLAVMAPYKSDDVRMVVSSIVVLDTGQVKDGKPVLEGRVCWSQARGPGAVALTKNTVVAVPIGFATKNTSFMRADVQLPYRAIFGSALLSGGSITLKETTPWPVRNVAEVVYDGVAPCLP
jgi:Flp pilus assembly protein TadG